MERVSDRSAVNLVADPISDAGGFFLPVPLLSFEQWTSTWTPDSPADNYRPPVNAERALIRSIGGGAHHENPITGIRDEGLPPMHHPASSSVYCESYVAQCHHWQIPSQSGRTTWCPSSIPETEDFLAPDTAISNEGQIDVNHVDKDRNQTQTISVRNGRFGHGHQETRVHTSSNPSAPSVPQGISSKANAVQYPGESASRDRSKKLQKSGNVPKKASSQPSRPPPGIGGAHSKAPYRCNICGKRYAQRQGVGRHYREKHGHPNSCSYCDFKWSRHYLYKAHLETEHRDVVSDAAQDDASRASNEDANTASSPQQQPVLTLTPEHGPRGGTETWWCPLTPPPSAVEPLGSAGPTTRRKRKREDAPESKFRAELLSAEKRAQLAKSLDMSVREVQTCSIFQDEGSPHLGTYGGNLVVEVPTDEPCGPPHIPILLSYALAL